MADAGSAADASAVPRAGPRRPGAVFVRGCLILCVVLIVHVSLYPFLGWRVPTDPSAQDVLLRHRSAFDLILNVAAYLPLGWLAGRLASRGGTLRTIVVATLCGAVLSLAMETLQLFMPGRVAALHDWATNCLGAILGGVLAAGRQGRLLARQALQWRARWLAPAIHAEFGALLVVIWIIAQLNPSLPFFEAGNIVNHLTADWQADPLNPLFLVPQVVAIAFNVCGFALFLSIPLTARIFAGIPVAIVLGGGLLLKFLAAGLLLKAPLLESWFGPPTVLGMLSGYFLALLLLGASVHKRVFMALILVFAGGLMSKMAGIYDGFSTTLQMFFWPHGQLGTFASATTWLAELWPVIAVAYLAWVYLADGRADGRTAPAAQVE